MQGQIEVLRGSEDLNKFDSNYLDNLLSFGLERLLKEADVLKVEKDQAEFNLRSVFLANYEGVLDTTKNLNTISAKLTEASRALDQFEKDIPPFRSACDAFFENCSSILEDAKAVKKLSAHQSQLTDLLDIPQLLDTCVRNGMYDEAMEVQSYVSRLQVLHPELGVVKALATQTQAASSRMLEQLLSRIRSGAQLPECLRAMGYVRRLAAFSDLEMRMVFLTCRDSWISDLIAEIDENNSFQYLKKLADVYRLHVYDTTMQYKTIFYEVKDSRPSSSPSSASSASSSAAAAVFSSWARTRMQFLAARVAAHLPRVEEGGQLAALAEHLTFCSSSLSRVGLDFLLLVEPHVNAAVVGLLAKNLAAAADLFAFRLASHKWISLPASSSAKSSPAPEDAGAAASSSSSFPSVIELPYSLLAHPPLAALVNGVAQALNELRLCSTAAAVVPAQRLLTATLERAAVSLTQLRRARLLEAAELSLLTEMAREMRDVALPSVQAAVRRMFGSAAALDLSEASKTLQKLVLL